MMDKNSVQKKLQKKKIAIDVNDKKKQSKNKKNCHTSAEGS